jgi:hypothetical protein
LRRSLQNSADLFTDGREDLAGRDGLRDERRHPPQRCLLVGDPCERLA